MPEPLRLQLTDYEGPTRWRWVLYDARGHFLADHEVRLDPADPKYRGFLDLSKYLDYYREAYPPEKQLADLGAWIGEQVFGGLRGALWQRRALPAVAVQVVVPESAQELLLCPFELACFADGKSFRAAGVRFVYQIEGTPAPVEAKEPAAKALRILAAFSLPVQANPLNLRRERHELQRLVRELNQNKGLAVELRVLQYGATRATLRDALEEAEGWDIVHLSGHGERGELLLENDQGGTDLINADDLARLLSPARHHLRLLILDACYSGAASHAAARAQVGLDKAPVKQEGAQGQAVAETAQTVLPSLGQELAQKLDCAALAMRYPVGDAFATELLLSLYDKLLDKRQPLPAALHLALGEALAADIPRPALSPATPILLGPRAADLQLAPPQRPPEAFVMPTVGLSIGFPLEPARFVGRLQPMLRASQALAPRSPLRGVLFYGMPGAGKTACALELAYRHAEGRFQGYVWYRAPEAGSDIAGELFNVLFEIERQLNAPGLGLTTALDDPQHFRRFTLPRLRALLQQNSLLLVLDNLETLLSESNRWRDPLWGDLMASLLAHDGPSRTVLTARRLPADLEKHPRLLVEAIHALSFAESVLLARELPNLKRLFADEAGLELLQRTLRVVQGHPKLLELADSLAADRVALARRVAAAADELAARADVLDAFFAVGLPREGETRQADADFVRALQGWTGSVSGGLSPTAGLLFTFLCRLEPEDRQRGIVQTVWPHFMERLGKPIPPSPFPRREGGAEGVGFPLDAALAALERAGLVAVERPEVDPALLAALQSQIANLPSPPSLTDLLSQLQAQAMIFTIHPGVAETARAAADPAVLAAADVELGNYHGSMFMQALKHEMQGGGQAIVASARRAAPYLLRQERWEEASTLLEHMLARDSSPATVAFALPLLRRIAEATAGTERGLMDAGVLANTLWLAGRTAEAEQMERARIRQCVTQGNYRLASSAAGNLLNLLRSSGRLAEALAVAGELAGYTQQAGLGPWTQLLGEGQRLQVLNALGRYDEVLAAVERLRPQMAALPVESQAEEAVAPWNVRETLLDTGREAALGLERWEAALALNAEIVKAKQARGAEALEVARRRFNDYGPLLRLRRYDDARGLLLGCRAVYEAERYVTGLGRVYSALADLEDNEGNRPAAVRFQEIALGYKYQAGQPEDCAISHHNLAECLARSGAAPELVLAQRLADAVICFQTQSGTIAISIRNLASSDLPATPPAFAAVAAQAEAIEGVRLQALFERLPRTAPDGDAAIAAVWQLVGEEKRKREERMAETLRKFEPRLQAIAAAVRDASLRPKLEPVLADLEQKGWMLRQPVQRVWAGERDAAALTAGIDGNSAQLVRRILALLA